MRLKFYVKHFAILAIAIITTLTISCQKQLLKPETGNSHHNDLSISEARSFFENHVSIKQVNSGYANAKKIMSTNAPDENHLTEKKAIWDKAYQQLISHGNAVKIPLDMGDVRLQVNAKTHAQIPYSQLNYLLMYKDSLETIKTEWVTLLPDSAWLYGARQVYTGKILIRDWDGKPLKVYNYKGHNIDPIGHKKISSGNQKTGSIVHSHSTLEATRIPDAVDEAIGTLCLIYRVPEKCTCRGACDWCWICTKTICAETWNAPTEIDEPIWSNGGTGGAAGGGGSGDGAGGAGDYTPQPCDPNGSATPQAPNQPYVTPCSVNVPFTPAPTADLDIDLGPFDIPDDVNFVYPQEWYDIEDEFAVIESEIAQQGIEHTDPIPEMYYKNGTPIDMAPAAPIGGRTVFGFPRNHKYFWKELAKLRPEMFDAANRAVILGGGVPKANEHWIKFNPTHKAYKDLPLRHHHEGQGRYAYAIPEKVHQKWSSILHRFRANGKISGISGKLNSLASASQILSIATDLITGKPDAWINLFGSQNVVGKIYYDIEHDVYFQITKKVENRNSSGAVIEAVITYDTFSDYIWDEDEHRYMGVQKLGSFKQDIDVPNLRSKRIIFDRS